MFITETSAEEAGRCLCVGQPFAVLMGHHHVSCSLLFLTFIRAVGMCLIFFKSLRLFICAINKYNGYVKKTKCRQFRTRK